jgi:GTP-binding protein
MSSRPHVRAAASRKVPKTTTPIANPAASPVGGQLADPNDAAQSTLSAPAKLPAHLPTHPAAKTAGMPAAVTPMGWMHTARFLTTAAQLHHLPEMDTPEIAFVGRSNAGKSTCINTLTQKKQLAFASKKPGRTQHINLFALGKQGITDAVLADLPGYGYAAVAKMDKLRWQQVMANYLVSRENLTGIVMMCDPRHGLTELDDILLEVIRPRVEEGLKFLIILTKADKLTRAEQAKALSIARLQAGGGEVKLFSALKKQGVDEVAQLLWDWTHSAAGAVAAPQAAEPPEEEPEALDE